MKSPFQIPNTHLFTYLCFVGLLFLHFQLGYIGHYGFDDMEYAKLASELSEGRFDFQNHFSYRLAIVVPTAISYLLFGVSDFASALPPLIASALILFFLTLFLKKEKTTTLAMALAITSLSPWFLRYSYMLMPDIYVCLAFVAAFYFLWMGRNAKSAWKYALGFSLSLLYGFMAKGTIVLILPVLVVFFVVDLLQKKNKTFWTWAIGSGILLLGLYFFLFYLASGDPWIRFKVIGENSYLNRCSYAEQSSSILLKRISVDFLNLLQYDHLLIYFLLLLPILVLHLVKRNLFSNDQTQFLVLSATLLLLSSNFMSISVKAYNPMCLDIRHYLFLIPLVSLPIAKLLTNEELLRKSRWALILCSLATFGVSLTFGNPDLWLVSGPISLLLIVYFIANRRISNQLFLGALVLVLVIKPIDMVLSAQASDYEGRRDFIITKILEGEQKKIILSDPVQSNLGNYYLGFDKSSIRFEDFRYYDPKAASEDVPHFYLENWHTAQQSFIVGSDIPFYIKNATSHGSVLENKELAIRLFEIKDFVEVEDPNKLILQLKNNFEAPIDPWIGSSDYQAIDPKNNNNRVHRVGEYSSTLQLSLDTAGLDTSGLFIRAKVQVFAPSSCSASLIVSLENENENILYESQPVDPLIKSFSNWWEVKVETSVSADQLSKAERLKVYVWNPEKKEMYLDNLQFSLYSN